MAQLVNRIVYLGIFLIFLTGLGSALRIVTDPEPYSELSEKINITCVPDGPTFTSKAIMSMQIMKQNEPTMVVIDNTQKLVLGDGSNDNMTAEGHVDKADASKSRLTLIIENPGRQDAGIYRCRVFYVDEAFNIVEDNVFGNVTYQEYEGCMKDETTIDYLIKENIQHRTLNERLNKDITQKQTMIRNLELQVKNLEQKSCPTTTKTGCPNGWTFYKGDKTCLKLFSQRLTWSKASVSCYTFGADLVIIRDQDKNKFVLEMYDGSDFGPWIGVKNQAYRGYNWKYVDGSALGSYHPWWPEQPEGDNGGNNCVFMSPFEKDLGQWRDISCSYTFPYVCSLVPA